ncbi:hypothetical protein ACWDV4_18225 [Micromonospora sp. NPDC003197]
MALRQDRTKLFLSFAKCSCGEAILRYPGSGAGLPQPGRRDRPFDVLLEFLSALAVPVERLGLLVQGPTGRFDRDANRIPLVRQLTDEIEPCPEHERDDLLGVERLPISALYAGWGVVVLTGARRGRADRRQHRSVGGSGEIAGDQRVLDAIDLFGGTVLDAGIPLVGEVCALGRADQAVSEIHSKRVQGIEISDTHVGEPLHLAEPGRLAELSSGLCDAVELTTRVIGEGRAGFGCGVGERSQPSELSLEQITIAHDS